MTRFASTVSIAACLAAGVLALAFPAAGLAAGHAGSKKAAGPSLNLLGFGINRLFVPKNTTVKSDRMCDEIVGSDSPVGPPQQVYLTVYAKATAIPHKAPTQIKDTLPYGYDEVSSPEFTDPGPFSNVFASGSLPFGAPSVSRKDLFNTLIVSYSSESGTYEGPSAEDFDGEYAYTAAVKAGGHTLTSTAKVKIDCPQYR